MNNIAGSIALGLAGLALSAGALAAEIKVRSGHAATLPADVAVAQQLLTSLGGMQLRSQRATFGMEAP
jgi:hypothetical protein